VGLPPSVEAPALTPSDYASSSSVRITPSLAALAAPRAPNFDSTPAIALSPPVASPGPPAAAPGPPLSARGPQVVVADPPVLFTDTQPPPEEDWDVPDVPPAEGGPVTAPPGALRPVLDLAQALTLLEMATGKEQIGRVLEDWLRSTFGCGLVLVVKGDMAMGWKGFFPDAEDLVDAVSIPLNKPTMFGQAYESRAPFRGEPPAEGAQLQERLWKLLRCPPPKEVLVSPVVLKKRVVNLLYAHMDDGSPLTDAIADEAQKLSTEAAAAYARMIDKDRKKR
jgi:hypothetical protein